MNASLRGSAGPKVIATCHGIEVLDAPHLAEDTVAAMAAGSYERREMDIGLALIAPGARVLEMGAGSGLVGAAIAHHCRPQAVLAIEANPNLIPSITALYAHNGLSKTISVRHGVVLTGPDAPPQVDFFVRGNFLGSSLTQPQRFRDKVSVPVLRYATLTQDYPHDTIMMDIEGGELDFLRHSDLSPVNLFIVEMHRLVLGHAGVRECRQLLAAAGLVYSAEHSLGSVQAFQRKPG